MAGENIRALFMVSAAKPTFTRSMKLTRYRTKMNGISRQAHLSKTRLSVMPPFHSARVHKGYHRKRFNRLAFGAAWPRPSRSRGSGGPEWGRGEIRRFRPFRLPQAGLSFPYGG